MNGWHLAQINIARFHLPKDHPDNAGFMTALDPVNAQADGAPGFVWRLVGDGNDAIGIDAVPDDPRLAVNMSVWTDLESLTSFVYRQPDHFSIMRRRRKWLEKIDVYMALWWVPVGHVPSVAEGLAKVAMLAERGPTPAAFTFRQPFAGPDGTPAAPQLDECA
jgi:Domain of unknown function (DUF3291)